MRAPYDDALISLNVCVNRQIVAAGTSLYQIVMVDFLCCGVDYSGLPMQQRIKTTRIYLAGAREKQDEGEDAECLPHNLNEVDTREESSDRKLA